MASLVSSIGPVGYVLYANHVKAFAQVAFVGSESLETQTDISHAASTVLPLNPVQL